MCDDVLNCIPIYNKIIIGKYKCKVMLNYNKVYKYNRKLGSGSYGEVFLCKEISTGKYYAHKKFKILEDTDYTKYIEEGQIMRDLYKITKNVPKYIKSFFIKTNDNYYYIICMEHIIGVSMSEYIMKYKLKEETLLTFIYWLFDTISKLHKKNYVHRDIKPENIMIDTVNNRLVLIDFGFCTKKENIKRSSTVGTVDYIAPESWQKKIKNSKAKKLDIWSAGVTIYYIIEKKSPWGTNIKNDETYIDISDVLDISNSIVHQENIVFSDTVPDYIKNIILLCLKKDPKQRYNSEKLLEKIILYIEQYIDNDKTESVISDTTSST